MERLPESVTAVMHFCPIDQNLLHITDRHRASDGEVYDGEVYDGNFRWYCLTCDYTYPIEEPVRIDVAVRPKEPGGIVGGEDAWSGARRRTACAASGAGASVPTTRRCRRGRRTSP